MERAQRGLTPLERGILNDLRAASAMTTGQLWRLRFLATGIANCRLRLSRLHRRGLLARLPARVGGLPEVCWCLTAEGAVAVGVPAAPVAATARRLAEDPERLHQTVRKSEEFVCRTLAERVRGPEMAKAPNTPPEQAAATAAALRAAARVPGAAGRPRTP